MSTAKSSKSIEFSKVLRTESREKSNRGDGGATPPLRIVQFEKKIETCQTTNLVINKHY